jgi:hemolysin III
MPLIWIERHSVGRTRAVVRRNVTKERPLLRGWLHALAIVPALLGTVVLVDATRGDGVKQASLLLYGVTLVLLFVGSAMYHVPTWSPESRATLRRIDHANIFVMIAGTYTPIAVTVLSGLVRAALLSLIWTLAIGGVAITLGRLSVPRGVLVALYLALGWISVAVMPLVVQRVGWVGFGEIAAGGVLYSLGAIVYKVKRPRLWAAVFSYHEVFHALVIAATGAFYVFIVQNVVPLSGH